MSFRRVGQGGGRAVAALGSGHGGQVPGSCPNFPRAVDNLPLHTQEDDFIETPSRHPVGHIDLMGCKQGVCNHTEP